MSAALCKDHSVFMPDGVSECPACKCKRENPDKFAADLKALLEMRDKIYGKNMCRM